MRYWETAHALADRPPVERDFAQIWRAGDKVVYSKTLETVSSARTRIEGGFDREAVRRMKAQASATSAWAVPTSPPRRSMPGWKTSHLSYAVRVVWRKGSLPRNVRLELELLESCLGRRG